MPTLQDVQRIDSVGIGNFTERQLQPIVNMMKQTGRLRSNPPECEGEGIVIAGGGRYLSWSWVLCKWLRELGCKLPIQVWSLGDWEMPEWARPLFGKLDVECITATNFLRVHPHIGLSTFLAKKNWLHSGWVLKNYAVEHCPWEQVLFLDADCFPFENPEGLLCDPDVVAAGSLFFSDIASQRPSDWAFAYCGLDIPETEWEAGQKIVHKTKGWLGLRWANWMSEHASVIFPLVHGDKEIDHLGFKVSGVPYLLSTERVWKPWGIEQSWKGKPWFAHSMAFKRGESEAPFHRVQELFWEWSSLKR
jgi:hypothetical protein